jgi:N-acetylneuraminate synthase
MAASFTVGTRVIAPGRPTYIIAEMSANHNQDFNQALRIVEAAKEAGADAIKLQTYTPDTITLNCDGPQFRIQGDSLWAGKNLYQLYGEAYTPWEWQPKLFDAARRLGLDAFSSPFDATAVDFLEKQDVPVHKIASFEVVDIPLVKKIARTGKPIIMSTGMATEDEIREAVQAIHSEGNRKLALLKCTSAYPAPFSEMNLRTIADMAQRFDVVSGLSDHTLGIAVPVAAVALGACIIEKHFTLSRKDPGPDSAFSLEPAEFKAMVEAVRATEQALGTVNYGYSAKEGANRIFRRSLFVSEDIRAGETLTEKNVRSVRPAHGLHTRHLPEVLGKKAKKDLKKGTPLGWDLID